jgi:site-specific recombinase XerD
MNHSLAKYVKRFFGHYLPIQRGLSDNTIFAYRDAIKLLLCYAADMLRKPVDRLTIEDIREKVVLGFLDHVEQDRGCTSRTRNARLVAVSSLFRFVAREEPAVLPQCQAVRTISSKRTAHRTVDYLEEKEMQAVLNAVNSDLHCEIRDKALLLLLYNTGARVSEIVELKIADLRLDAAGHVRLLGKGKKQRSCPLWPETVDAIHGYLKHRMPKNPGIDYLFLNAQGVRITRFGIRHIISKYAEIAAIQCPSLKAKSISPHTIRHTTAMHLLRAGNDINMVRYWLGHASINTTHIYIEIDMEMKRKMLQKTPAPAVKETQIWQKPEILQWLDRLTKQPELCEVNR